MNSLSSLKVPREKLSKRIAYLCLQVTREGQASHAHVHEIIAGLQRRGWIVKLYEPFYRSTEKLPGPVMRLVGFLFTQLRLWTSGRPDILYVRWHFAVWPTALWALLGRIRVVQEVNGPYEDLFLAWPITRRFTRLFIWLMRSQLRWADAVIAVTPQLAEWVQQETGQAKAKAVVVPNGANTELFHPSASAPVPLPEKYVVFFGALAPWQGIDTMLKAVEESEWPAEVKLVIVGDGVEKRAVLSAAQGGRVVYLGVLPYAQVSGVVARSIAGLSPQTAAGERSDKGLSPLKVFETLACGVPVIVTDFPGQADLVRSATCGIVIPPDNPRALAKAVAYLYHHPEERVAMGKRGRELVEREHSWDSRAEQVDAVLRMVLGND